MKKEITTQNKPTLFRKITGSCHAIMVNADLKTMNAIREFCSPYSVVLGDYRGKPMVVVNGIPPNEKMLDALEVPVGDYIVKIQDQLYHHSWKSFHAIYEEVPNNGSNVVHSVSEVEFTFWERVRLLLGCKFHSHTKIVFDTPVSIIKTTDTCFVELFFRKPIKQQDNGQVQGKEK